MEESKRTQSSAVSSTGTPADVGLESEVHLSDFLAVVRRRWRVVLSVFTALFLLTAFVNFTKSPIYEGKATLRIGEDKVPFAFGKFDPFQEQPDPIHSEIEIMRSRTIAEEVVRTRNLQFALGKLPEGFELVLGEGSVRAERVETSGSFTLRFLDSHGRFEVFSGEGLSVSQGSVGWPFQGGDFSFVIESASPIEAGLEFDFAIVPFRAAAENLRTRLKVSPRGKTNVVTINVKAGSPEEAASTANEVARVYMQSTIERRTEQASRTKTFVETQLTTLRGRLENAEKELRNYKAEVGVMSLDQDTERILEPWTRREVDRGELSAAIREAEAILTALDSAPDRTSPTRSPLLISTAGIPNNVLQELAGLLTSLELERARLSGGLAPQHREMVRLDAEIVEARTKVRDEVEGTLTMLRERETSLGEVIGGYEDKLKELPGKELGLVELLRELKVSQQLYTILSQQFADAQIAEAAESGKASWVDPAITNRNPSSPRVAFNLILASMVGLTLGIGLAFLRDYFDRSIRSIEHLDALGLSTFGSIPEIGERRARLGAPEATVGDRASRLIANEDSSSFVAEAYRALRTNIRFATHDSKAPCFAVTSSIPGEGKSLTCSNLAVSIAETGSRVLLVDADLRRPTVHRVFGLDRDEGLSQVLAGSLHWRDSVQSTKVKGLSVLSGGRIPPNPAELLGSNRMVNFLEEVRTHYDLVIVDTPPILPFTDAGVFCHHVDGIFLVVRAGLVSSTAVKRAKAVLEAIGARVRGAILNGISYEEGFGVSGYTSYYYSYYLRQNSDQEPKLQRFIRKVRQFLRIPESGDFSDDSKRPAWADPGHLNTSIDEKEIEESSRNEESKSRLGPAVVPHAEVARPSEQRGNQSEGSSSPTPSRRRRKRRQRSKR